ncbi:MAG: hypothetical protein EA384_16340 [Spirochaetaceae bacterium]|nr:MAG: hypothetical protein EA384_16340 [Spirochaetaceae bacterium]
MLRVLPRLSAPDSGTYAGAAAIAGRIEAPRNCLAKLLQLLARHGVVDSREGVGEGFCLARPAGTDRDRRNVRNRVMPKHRRPPAWLIRINRRHVPAHGSEIRPPRGNGRIRTCAAQVSSSRGASYAASPGAPPALPRHRLHRGLQRR